MGKLKTENPFFEFMGKLGDLILLNIVFVISCIPIITIGASITALYKVTLKLNRNESNYVCREFFDAFKKELKAGTKIWIPVFLSGAVLAFDLMYVNQIARVIEIGVGCLIVLWCFVFTYVFPLQAQFVNSTKNTISNALKMSVRHLPYTIIMVLINLIPFVCFFSAPMILSIASMVYIFMGFAIAARVNSILLDKIFQQYIEEE